jgi:lipoprotein-anchoring transpeptidase ErfK/SrfK
MRTNGVRAVGVLAATLALLGVTACSSERNPLTGTGTEPQPSATASTAVVPNEESPSPTTPPEPAAVALAANVADQAKKVTVDTLVKVTAKAGTLTKVKVAYRYVDRDGTTAKGTVAGALSKDKASWTAAERLEPAATYTISMTGKNTAGASRSATSRFTTHDLSLDEQTYPSIYPQADSKVGIGMPVVLTFDVPVRDKKEFQKNLEVTSSPAQSGTWNWFSDTQVRFRPANYWKPGTKVEVRANLNGVNAGNGVYGQKSVATSFTVGRSLVTKVDLARDVAKVYRNGKLVKTIAVSGGKPGWETRSGVKLIMAKEYNKKMTNEMIGAKEDYSLTARHALRITNSGEFLHSAPWNSAHLGRRNASHGCVGMSNGNAEWLYNNTLIGDPVVTTGTRRRLEQGNGYSDWNISFAQYKKGSAL